MAGRNLPGALAPKKATPAMPARPAKPAVPASSEPVCFYLAVPDRRFLKALRHARLFASPRHETPVELRVFYEPNLPNVPFESLQLLGALTELGTVSNEDGDLELTTIKPEKLP